MGYSVAAKDIPCDCVTDIGVRVGRAGDGGLPAPPTPPPPPVTEISENVRVKR